MPHPPVSLSPAAIAAQTAIAAAGGQAALAKQLGVTRNAVWQWSLVGIPPGRLPAVEIITGISPRALRPDLYQQAAPRSCVAA